MKILVTGATGFIGKFLITFLLEKKISVRILARKFQHNFPKTIEQYIGDLTVPSSLIDITKDVDIVFHLGGYAHAWENNSKQEATNHTQINYLGTQALLNECSKTGGNKFIFFSSIKAVEDTEEYINEEWKNLPKSEYGRAKRAAEDLILQFGKKNNTHVCILRLSLVYGPGWKGNLDNMLRAIDKGYFLPIPPVNNHRSLVSVYDVCQAAWLVASDAKANGKIYFVTDKQTYSTFEIYKQMRSALGKSSLNWYIPLWFFKILALIGDAFEKIFKKRFIINSQALQKLFGSSHCSSVRIQEELGFTPQYSLQQLLPDIVNRYRIVND